VKNYLDTSALIKLYYPEPESALLSEWITSKGQALILTSLHEVELSNALALKVFRKEMKKKDYQEIRKMLASDIKNGVLFRISLSWGVLTAASLKLIDDYTPKFGCRSLDVLHVAAALEAKCQAFFSFDDRQKRLARASGLKILEL
jgi:predicted nucleic acid-binding protein